jgi:hypothetical protein
VAIQPLNFSDYKLVPEDPVFVTTFTPEVSQLDVDTAALDGLGDVAAGLDIAAIASMQDSLLNPIASAIADELGSSSSSVLPDVDAAANNFSNAFTGVDSQYADVRNGGAGIPTQIPPIRGHAPPPPIVVTQPAAPPPPVVTPPGPPGPAPRPASVSLFNNSQPGALGGKVGDSFALTIRGTPGGSVSVNGAHDGVAFTNPHFGNLNQDGIQIVTGIWDYTYAGAWLENWFVDGALAGTLNFEVK